VKKVRDAAAERLERAMPDQRALIERFLIGRDATPGDKARRVRMIPLPSIGHAKTNRAIRRLRVSVPPECPFLFSDVEWAFSGLTLVHGRMRETILVGANDLSMLRHDALGSGESYRVWRSVTPVALPQGAERRRIDPLHRSEQAKPVSERLAEERRACAAALQALRHADVPVPVGPFAYSNGSLRAGPCRPSLLAMPRTAHPCAMGRIDTWPSSRISQGAGWSSSRPVFWKGVVLEGRAPWRDERDHLGLLDDALRDMVVLKAGRDGRLNLSSLSIDPPEDCLFGRFKSWESVTP
jgi:CRISPR-associated protein Csb2